LYITKGITPGSKKGIIELKNEKHPASSKGMWKYKKKNPQHERVKGKPWEGLKKLKAAILPTEGR